MTDLLPTKKPKAPKKPSPTPKYEEMIAEAISALKERSGSSVAAIKKYIGEQAVRARWQLLPVP